MPFVEGIVTTLLRLQVAGVSVDELATVGVILAIGYGAVTAARAILEKQGKTKDYRFKDKP